MKKLFTTTLLLLSTLGFSQTTQAVHVGPNKVEVIARHCAKYNVRHNWFARHILREHNYLDSAACQADPSTIYATDTGYNLKTNGGVDFISAQVSGTGGTATAQWIALSTDSTTVHATDTSLASEIVANGLGRVQAGYAHTNGTATYTLTEIFTATGAQSNIWKTGVFTAASSGTLVYEILLSSSITMNTSDQLQVVWTVTIS